MQVFIASYRYYLMGCWDSPNTRIVGVYSSREHAEAALDKAVEGISEDDLLWKNVQEYTLDEPILGEVA